ncbi:hypothetical protein ACFFP0_28310 [Rhizobium puerariae]|uniref:Uncharacterized protein n=1 Tax=Rhizobium puerariae TaxID=1585791 RepID=A0ABV6ASP5_9HYPH
MAELMSRSLALSPEALTLSPACADFMKMPDCMSAVRQIVILLFADLPVLFALAK